MKNQYVILTGCKNNAGDFLITHRALGLFKTLRPDRKIIDFNSWEEFDKRKLKIINESKALILLGGPSLQKDMRPTIYKMTDCLNDIKVPILTFGIGWKSLTGNWSDTFSYPLNNQSIELLDRINNSGYKSSVRDFHTLNVLRFKGYENFLMTGCPAYYDIDFINTKNNNPSISKVAFSLGVSFIKSNSMLKLMKENILRCINEFDDAEFSVVFHHSLNAQKFINSGASGPYHNLMHRKFAKWLESNNINFVDISGSADKLIRFYNQIDLHIGYRVHAHIFMTSINKPSILISEDGRGNGVYSVISGCVLNSIYKIKTSIFSKILYRISKRFDPIKPNYNLTNEILNMINYEKKTKFLRLQNSRSLIDNNYELMREFICQLP